MKMNDLVIEDHDSTWYAIVTKDKPRRILSTHKDHSSAMDELNGIDDTKRDQYVVVNTNKPPRQADFSESHTNCGTPNCCGKC